MVSSTKNELVVKSNRLIEASYRLSLAEQRIILMAITEVRKSRKDFNAEDFIEVRAVDFANLFDTDVKNTYIQLQDAAKSLFSRYVVFKEIDQITGKQSVLEARGYLLCSISQELASLEFSLVGCRTFSDAAGN